MSLVASVGIDPREEMDDAVLQAKLSRSSTAKTTSTPAALKTKFMIRTLPKDCNPTPLTALSSITTSASSLLSPTARKLPPHAAPAHSASATVCDEHLPDNPFDDITEEKLQKLSGQQDLSRVTHLQIAVDSGKQSVEAIGELLPSLQQLKLQHSTLHSFRDLGTSLHALQILWVMRSGISDLDGIGALTALQELYLQYNDISDLSPLTLHDEIQVIDLEGNCVADIGQIEQLAFCAHLTTLNLEANPVCSIARYRQIIANFLPQLTTLDDKPITPDERIKLSDEDIDAAIQAHRDALHAEQCAPATVDDRMLIADGIKASSSSSSNVLGHHLDDQSSRRLSRTSSAQRIALDAVAETMRNDSGSSLTHGTDIVFAGNVTSSLRRHRSSETEACDSQLAAISQQLAAETNESVCLSTERPKTPMDTRPKTPARMSITDTLDRANELEFQKHKSRDAILNELKAWQQEGAVSQLGVTHVPRDRSKKKSERSSPTKAAAATTTTTTKRRSVSTRAHATTERRPNTSAGVLRNGASIKEAFVEASSGVRRTTKSSAPLHRRSSFSSSMVSVPSSSSSGHVDILILDDCDERRPCSPTKSARGIFTTGSDSREWNLDALAPKLDRSMAETSWRNFPQSSNSGATSQQLNDRVFQKTHRYGSNDDDEDDDDNDEHHGTDSSDSDGVSRSRHHHRRSAARKPTSLSTKTSSSTAFFNVAESLHAIDKWRDDMDDDDKQIVRVGSYQPECLALGQTAAATEDSAATAFSINDAAVIPKSSPAVPNSSNTSSANQHAELPLEQQQASPNPQQLQLGPANFETDARIVELMKTKHRVVAETKMRDGFRRYFRGIEVERLERILQHVFADPEKVRRRLQLMTGFYRHELSSSSSE